MKTKELSFFYPIIVAEGYRCQSEIVFIGAAMTSNTTTEFKALPSVLHNKSLRHKHINTEVTVSVLKKSFLFNLILKHKPSTKHVTVVS